MCQVLTWVNANSDWEPQSLPAGTINNNAYFTSSGTWTCLRVVTNVFCRDLAVVAEDPALDLVLRSL